MENIEITPPTQEQIDHFWANVAVPRASRLEFNFKEKAVTLGLINQGGKTTFVDEEAWKEKVLPLVNGFWHSEGKDELEFLILYTDDTFLCQKKRLKYDFATQSSYWLTYEFNECKVSDVIELCDALATIVTIQREVETNKLLEEVRQLTAVDYYYDYKWYKKKDEINKMLLFSDWRVLPDAPQKFEGERDLWIIWRQKLRELLPSNPRETFETNVEMFKFITTLKYPIDPRVYYENFPEMNVEYLSTDEQYVKYDFESSKDFTSNNVMNLVNFMETYDEKLRPVERKVIELSKKLRLEEVYRDLDYSKFMPID
jgi:hypothetical protein